MNHIDDDYSYINQSFAMFIFIAMTIYFVVLKLTGKLLLSWCWTLVLLWGPPLVLFTLFTASMLVLVLVMGYDIIREKLRKDN